MTAPTGRIVPGRTNSGRLRKPCRARCHRPPSWTSPVSGHTYATSWQVRFGPGYAAELGLDTLYLHALVQGCENLLPDPGNAYWEGAVSVSSDPEGLHLVGQGFVEQMGFN